MSEERSITRCADCKTWRGVKWPCVWRIVDTGGTHYRVCWPAPCQEERGSVAK